MESKQVENYSEDAFRYRYESSGGKTLVKVLAPEGAHVEVFDGPNSVASDDIPTSFTARGDVFYRYVIRWPNGASFEKKFQAKKGQTFSLWVNGPTVQPSSVVVVNHTMPAPAPVEEAPRGMSRSDFDSLKAAIAQESFSSEKIGVLRTASDGAWFTADQVGQLIDIYDFSKDKLEALEIVKGKIVDRKNNYKILGHFDFSGDKEAAQKMLR